MAIQSARPAPSTRAAAGRSRGFLTQTKRVLGRDWPVAYLFAGPLVLLLFGLIGYPLVYAVWMSTRNLTNVTDRGFVGLFQYRRLWGDAQFVRSVLITIQFAVVSVFFKFWVGLLAALLLNRKGLRFRSVFTGLVLLPWIIPEVVAALTWRGIYDPVFGGLNMLLLSMGVISTPIAWLGDYRLALPAMILVNTWKGIPFFTIILLAGLKAIPADLYDAAGIDGANPWQRFWNVTLPGLRYVVIVACLLSMIFTLNAFGLVYLITGGGPGGATRLFSILAYEYGIGERRFSLGVAVAMAVVPLLLVLVVILGRYMRGDPSSTADAERQSPFNLMLPWMGVAALLMPAFGWQGALPIMGVLTALGIGLTFFLCRLGSAGTRDGAVLVGAGVVALLGAVSLYLTRGSLTVRIPVLDWQLAVDALLMVAGLGVMLRVFLRRVEDSEVAANDLLITLGLLALWGAIAFFMGRVFGAPFAVLPLAVLLVKAVRLVRAQLDAGHNLALGSDLWARAELVLTWAAGLVIIWRVFGLQVAALPVLVMLALGIADLIDRVASARRRSTAVAAAPRDARRDAANVRTKQRLGNTGAYIALAAVLLFELFPFYWVIITAFKTNRQMQTFQSIFWPAPWTLEHFRYMLTETSFTRWFFNTLQVTIVSVIVSVLVGALGAYALTRLRWRGAGLMSTAILFAYLMPGVMLFIPLYRLFTRLGLVDTLQALMVAYPTFGLPFACWLLMGYYRSIPAELEEAALIDGCNYFQAFFRIILPLTLPALLTVALFALTGAFNEFLFAYVFVRPESLQTLPVGLAKMVIGDIFPWGRMFAASIMTTIPVTIVYILAQRFMVEGLTAGSVKG